MRCINLIGREYIAVYMYLLVTKHIYNGFCNNSRGNVFKSNICKVRGTPRTLSVGQSGRGVTRAHGTEQRAYAMHRRASMSAREARRGSLWTLMSAQIVNMINIMTQYLAARFLVMLHTRFASLPADLPVSASATSVLPHFRHPTGSGASVPPSHKKRALYYCACKIPNY